MVNSAIAKLGENITIRRFARFKVAKSRPLVRTCGGDHLS